MYRVAAHIMDKRVDSMNMITIDSPYAPMQEYVNQKRKEGISISHMSLIISAYIRTMAKYPELNRFVVNRKIYARNEIAVGMVVLQSLESHEGTMSKMYFEKTDTIFDVNNKINAYVTANRETPENNGTEKIIKILLSIPGLLTVGVKLFKFMDAETREIYESMDKKHWFRKSQLVKFNFDENGEKSPRKVLFLYDKRVFSVFLP